MRNIISCILPYCRCPAYAKRAIRLLAQNCTDRSFEKINLTNKALVNFHRTEINFLLSCNSSAMRCLFAMLLNKSRPTVPI